MQQHPGFHGLLRTGGGTLGIPAGTVRHGERQLQVTHLHAGGHWWWRVRVLEGCVWRNHHERKTLAPHLFEHSARQVAAPSGGGSGTSGVVCGSGSQEGGEGTREGA